MHPAHATEQEVRLYACCGSDSDIIAEEEVDRLAAGYETAEHIDVHTVDDSSSESESSAD